MGVKVYRQKREDSCAICCMMMVMEYFGIISCNSYYEKHFYYKLKSNYISGTPLSAVAWYLNKLGLEVEIFHSSKDIFVNNEYLDNYTFLNCMDEYKKYLSYCENKGVVICNGISIDGSFIKNKIKDNYLIILSGIIGNVLHAVLVENYDEEKFVVCDSLCKEKVCYSEEEIDKFCDTPLGKWCVCVKINK